MWRRRMKMTLTEFGAAVAVAVACQRRPTRVVRNRARHGKRPCSEKPWEKRDSNHHIPSHQARSIPPGAQIQCSVQYGASKLSRGTSSLVEMMGEKELHSIDGGNG
ncbi:hypothetical protein BJV77DRAFT_1007252 [Russula vinacea]|nr:hypothetical protein BJV77DRAFT_1007252 [Russula vinacea]